MARVAGPRRQLALDIQLRDDATLDNFLVLPEAGALIAALQTHTTGDGDTNIFVHGSTGSGKSHLLQAACHMTRDGALYLPLKELQSYPPREVLNGVERLPLVCLDDLDSVVADDAWEEELFDVFNRARESNCRLIFAARGTPRTLPIGLADLRSRLSWGAVYQLPGLTDERRIQVLEFRAARRGLALSTEVAAYIVNRAPRSLDSLLAVLDELDRSSLVAQRALSIPFVKQVMGW